MQSRKNHGSAGDQFLPIALNLPINGPITIEPRDARRGHTLIFDFGTAIATAGTATVIDAGAQPIGQAYTTPSGNTVVVTLTNIPDNQRVTVQLAGINGFGTASVSLGFLVGDINGSQKVNGADFSAIKAKAAGMGTPAHGGQLQAPPQPVRHHRQRRPYHGKGQGRVGGTVEIQK